MPSRRGHIVRGRLCSRAGEVEGWAIRPRRHGSRTMKETRGSVNARNTRKHYLGASASASASAIRGREGPWPFTTNPGNNPVVCILKQPVARLAPIRIPAYGAHNNIRRILALALSLALALTLALAPLQGGKERSNDGGCEHRTVSDSNTWVLELIKACFLYFFNTLVKK